MSTIHCLVPMNKMRKILKTGTRGHSYSHCEVRSLVNLLKKVNCAADVNYLVTLKSPKLA